MKVDVKLTKSSTLIPEICTALIPAERLNKIMLVKCRLLMFLLAKFFHCFSLLKSLNYCQ